MESLVKYLENPMEAGICRCVLHIDFSKVKDYFKEIIDGLRNTEEEVFSKYPLKSPDIQRTIIDLENNLAEPLSMMEKDKYDERFFKWLFKAFYEYYVISKNSPQSVRRLFVQEDNTPEYRSWGPVKSLFESHFSEEYSDVVLIKRTLLDDYYWEFDCSTLNEETMKDFLEKLYLIPTLKGNIDRNENKVHFSERYVYKPYPLAVKFLLTHDSPTATPEELKNYLSAAVKYFLSQEWRTSIVLSAIAIESQLADLFEEAKHKRAPDVALGKLFENVGKDYHFPQEITDAVLTAK
jgi:hypothetical protein